MANTTSSLEHFDFLQLLQMLAANQKTGVLTVYSPVNNFEAWLQEGRIRAMHYGQLNGVLALAALLKEPRGRFHFEDGRLHPNPTMNELVDAVAVAAMNIRADSTPPFPGAAKFTSPERIESMEWSEAELIVIRNIEQQKPLRELWPDATARQLITKLIRLGLLRERKSRVARLTIKVTREVRGVAVVDEVIMKRWKDDLVRHPQLLALRGEEGQTYTFPLRSSPALGTQLLLPPDLIMQTRLRAGESVLVKPV